MAGHVRMVDIREEPLSVDEVLTTLSDTASGGLAVFIGRVRDHDGDRKVTGLDYSAHPTALRRLREVCAEIAGEYDGVLLSAVHRTGVLDIGDAAVVVAAASGHRDQAFDAARALIDRLKAEVPIWKHQSFADGTDEWVGTP